MLNLSFVTLAKVYSITNILFSIPVKFISYKLINKNKNKFQKNSN
jgi:hypothetical protein